MQPRIKLGLTIGAIGLVLNICVAGFIGLCGPVLSLIAGAVAGYLTTMQEKPATKSDGARAGAISGAVAGVLIIVGQILGGIGALIYIQSTGAPTLFGDVPSISSDPAQLVGYYIGGIGTGICFGVVGALLAAGTGAGAGYLATTEQTGSIPPTSTEQ
ncbi:MAG TPA: hypothetical protein DCX53_17050 [Anaerolineae bacterium]|nr:hypothetical protein [Anaerolineae bacterium]